MNIGDLTNNCGPTAFHRILPDRDEKEVLEICFEAGFDPDVGMFPHHIHEAARMLGLITESTHAVQLHDLRQNLTLHQTLIATSEHVCLIRVSGHVVASNRGILIDPYMSSRRSRRRVLETLIIHNATIPATHFSAISRDPTISFIRDVCDETQSGSYRRSVFEKVNRYMAANELTSVSLSELRQFGYTRKMLKRHLERGDAVAVD
jgi:hypothetical protein